jgi:hypothetical protein
MTGAITAKFDREFFTLIFDFDTHLPAYESASPILSALHDFGGMYFRLLAFEIIFFVKLNS